MGMSRRGFRASCAAVETASNPMYAKKITAAPRMMPDRPNSPNVPVFGGTSGVNLVESTNAAPATITSTTTATLTTTMTPLTVADSRTPRTRSAVTSSAMITAGRLKMAVTVLPSAAASTVPGAALTMAGNGRPASFSRLTKYADHPTATVAAPSAYSSTRSHPMIHATNSPSVTYEYV